MKFVYLVMNYFGFYEYLIIDFSKLESILIFLISGDIGVGKLIIFDVMIFVFFGSMMNDGMDGWVVKEMCS